MTNRITASRIAAVLCAAIALGITVALIGSPSGADASLSTQLQVARDQLANCQLLAANSTGNQHARAVNCVTDQQRIIALLTQPSPTPSASPSASPSPTVTASPTPPPTTLPPTTVPPSPSPSPTPTPPPSACSVAGTNKPGAADPWGGCFPGPGNTGVPSGTVLAAYTGPCTITTAGAVINSKLVSCDLLIRAANVQISKSEIRGQITNSGSPGASFTITDSLVVNPATDGGCLCIGDHDYTATRVEVRGSLRGGWCASHCVVQDSWSHGRLLGYFDNNGQSCAPANAVSVPAGCVGNHGSGWREEQFGTFSHNTLACDFLIANDTTSLGCSADLTGYADFNGVHDNVVTHNLFVSVGPVQHVDDGTTGPTPVSYCAYGGDTQGKPHSGDPGAGTNQRFTDNVFQRGLSGRCGDFGPVTDFNLAKPGNVFTGNVFDNGAPIVLS